MTTEQNKTQETLDLYDQYVIPSYLKNGLVLVQGEGSYVWDVDGKRYLDLYPGWGSNPLGHAPKELHEVIQEQARVLLHLPNNYCHPGQAQLAKTIIEKSFKGKCFFANSGAEANEGALKLARLVGSEKGRYEVITFKKSFHGRTFATLTATGQDKVHKGFEPLVEGFHYADFNYLESVKKFVNAKTAAIMLEPIQGEGGVYPATLEFLKGLRALCDKEGILLIFDEVQTGVGRIGNWFGYQHYGVEPDVMTLAKSLGGGIPIGAFVAKTEFANKMQPGTHASTFGGSPFVSAVSLAVFNAIEEQNLLEHVNQLSEKAFHRFNQLKDELNVIKDVRGCGFLIGIEVDEDPSLLITKCMERGVLVNRAGTNVLRILPALNIQEEDLMKGLQVIEEVLRDA